MKNWKFTFVLHKKYFDKGYSLTNYVKYLIALFGLSSLDVKTTLLLGVIYAISCYFIGRLWIKFKFFEEEQEVNNIFNKFVRETREFIKNGKIGKNI